jgi:filamentous hemagglutinin family protein
MSFVPSQHPAVGQIIPDETLGNERSQLTPNVTINGQLADQIEAGARRGNNLFHSFSQFNVSNGQRVYFGNPVGVENILSRVTGINSSNILGTLGVNGRAKLSFINPNTRVLMQQGLELYQAEQFVQAIALWQQAIAQFTSQGDTVSQALAWRYLALAYQESGNWQEAERAIATSLNLLQPQPATTPSPVYLEVLAKALNTQGRLQWEQGQLDAALETWQQATLTYRNARHDEGVVSSVINQAKVLQALGLNLQAKAILQTVFQTLQQQPASDLKATGLRHLGRSLRRVGALEDSWQMLQASLAIAQQPASRSATLLELGNTASAFVDRSLAIGATTQVEMHLQTALTQYQQASQLPVSPLLKLQPQLNQVNLLIKTKKWTEAKQLLSTLQPLVTNLPPSRTGIYAQLNFVQSLMEIDRKERQDPSPPPPLSPLPPLPTIVQLLGNAIQQARALKDSRAESYALGQLGELYAQNHQWSEAQTLTQQALLQLEGLTAPEIRYRWEWQAGRLLQRQGNTAGAIAAYQRAIQALESVRNDLLLVDAEIQFSFRDHVEPIYRELVDLLLKPGVGAEVSQAHLKQVVAYVDALQLAELENFLRCDLSQAVGFLNQPVDQVRASAAFIYPILLRDRLEVIYRLPGQPLKHHTQPISRTDAEHTLKTLRRSILRGDAGGVIARSTQVYQWLMEPLEADLNRNGKVKTLVFVLDGELRNVPMAVLYDAKANEYLIEKPYGLTLLPSSQLFNLSIAPKQPQVLGAGISEPLQVGDRTFAALNVSEELAQVQQSAASEILLNAQFTRSQLQQKLSSDQFSVVHLATHGNFSSNPDETYILIHSAQTNQGELLRANEFDRLLRGQQQETESAIDLLILSACKTAEGDNRATLGLAGLAVRAGARSTLATLWQVSDASTVKLMQAFYKALSQPGTTKAEALRQAQIQLLRNPQYQTPYYWAPYVLVGNWR